VRDAPANGCPGRYKIVDDHGPHQRPPCACWPRTRRLAHRLADVRRGEDARPLSTDALLRIAVGRMAVMPCHIELECRPLLRG
jgi:hypothetical protein